MSRRCSMTDKCDDHACEHWGDHDEHEHCDHGSCDWGTHPFEHLVVVVCIPVDDAGPKE